ncbi:hypothetical protein Rsub_12306 [Raphidocelis subcapitata]|uniref:Uncharacterized protein n=1 Tax=Raphidocelis subcapitata TaxID=307507 RepID=A0A2V0PQ59_9CHLO|nr:hypothetical protein Rsub_12306 [Raphidocelis subcapitata]|eukprot:GBF99627.1 hypothetical protein Rsub_12306 [Raphidocelis subcapitata]
MSSEAAGSSGGGGGGPPEQPAGPAPKGLGAGLKPKRKPAGAKAAAAEAKPAPVPRLPIPAAPRSEEGEEEEEVIEIDAVSRPYRGGRGGIELDLIGDDLDDAFGPGEDDEEGAWESASNASEEMRTLMAVIGKGAGAGGKAGEDGAVPLLEELFDRGTLLVCGSVLGACAAALVLLGLRASVRGAR